MHLSTKYKFPSMIYIQARTLQPVSFPPFLFANQYFYIPFHFRPITPSVSCFFAHFAVDIYLFCVLVPSNPPCAISKCGFARRRKHYEIPPP